MNLKSKKYLTLFTGINLNDLSFVAGGDFYPFGLTMEDRQIKVERYRYGYQGQYAEKDSLTNLNQFQLRMYEPRFGRWLSPDPYNQFSSPYNGMANLPMSAADIDGGYIFLVNNAKRLSSFMKSLNRYYSTTAGKQFIDKYINDPHSHIELWVSETRIQSKNKKNLEGESVEFAAGNTVTGNYSLVDQQKNVLNVSQGDNQAVIHLNAKDIHPASKQFTEAIGHEIQAHADFQFTFGKTFGDNNEHSLFGSDKLLGYNWASAINTNSSAQSLAKEVYSIKNRNILNHFAVIGLSRGLTKSISQLVFKPSIKRLPRYIPSRSKIP